MDVVVVVQYLIIALIYWVLGGPRRTLLVAASTVT